MVSPQPFDQVIVVGFFDALFFTFLCFPICAASQRISCYSPLWTSTDVQCDGRNFTWISTRTPIPVDMTVFSNNNSNSSSIITNQYTSFAVVGKQVSGTIPSSLSMWTSLQTISIARTLVSGTLPLALSTLTAIQFFHVSSSLVSGTIPGVFSLWTRIQYFDVSRTHISGTIPSSLSAWTNLMTFRIHSSEMSGTISPYFSTWKALQVFDVGSTFISGTIPQELTTWTRIVKCNVSTTQLRGSIPGSWSVQSFDASNTQITLLSAPSFTCVSCTCRRCNISELELTSGSKFIHIDFSHNVYKEIPRMISPGITFLSLDDCFFHSQRNLDAFLSSRSASPMSYLSLQRSQLTGTLPSVVFCVARTLDLRGNHFSGTVPSRPNTLCAPNNSVLLSLDISYNRLVGPLLISQQLAAILSNVKELTASSNSLTAFVLPEGVTLPSLLTLRLNRNNFSQNIEQISIPDSLQVLDLSRNELLSGTFPSTTSGHAKLKSLLLGNTQVSTLPQHLSPLLECLDLSNTPWRSRTPWLDEPLPDRFLYVNVEPDLKEGSATGIDDDDTTGREETFFPPTYTEIVTPLVTSKSSGQVSVSRLHARNIQLAETQRSNTYGSFLASNHCNSTALQNRGLYEDYVFSKGGICLGSSWMNEDGTVRQCEEICRSPEIVFAHQPRVRLLTEVESPVLQFFIPSTFETRLCECPKHVDFIDFDRVDYIFRVQQKNASLSSVYLQIQNVFSVLLDGTLELPMSGFPFVFGVDYEVSVVVMFSKHITGPQIFLTSTPFQLEGCPDPINQAAVVGTSYCAPCPLTSVCNGTITVIAGDNMYRPNPKYAMFIPCDESTRACTTGSQHRQGHECAEGYSGFLCSVCSEGFGKSGSVCSQCPNVTAQQTIVVVSVLAMYVFYVFMCFTAAVDVELEEPVEREMRKRSISENTQSNKVTEPTSQMEPVPEANANVEGDAADETNANDTCNNDVDAETEAKVVLELFMNQMRQLVITPILRLVKLVMTWLFCMGVLFQSSAAAFLFQSVRSVLGYSQQIATASPLNSNAFYCMFSRSVYVRFIVYSVGAIPVAIVCTATLYLVTSLVGLRKSWPSSIYSSVVCCMALVYPQVIVSIIEILQCDLVEMPLWGSGEGGGGTLYDRFNLLKADRRISCEDTEYTSYRTAAAIAGVLYGIGFPALCFILHPKLPRNTFNFISKDVLPHAWWWELFVMLRKALLLLCVTVVAHEYLQLITYIAVLWVVVGVFIRWMPYEDRTYNVLELLSIVSCSCNALLLGFLQHYRNTTNEKWGIAVGLVIIVSLTGFVYLFYFVTLILRGIKLWSEGRKYHGDLATELEKEEDNHQVPPSSEPIDVDVPQQG